MIESREITHTTASPAHSLHAQHLTANIPTHLIKELCHSLLLSYPALSDSPLPMSHLSPQQKRAAARRMMDEDSTTNELVASTSKVKYQRKATAKPAYQR